MPSKRRPVKYRLLKKKGIHLENVTFSHNMAECINHFDFAPVAITAVFIISDMRNPVVSICFTAKLNGEIMPQIHLDIYILQNKLFPVHYTS